VGRGRHGVGGIPDQVLKRLQHLAAVDVDRFGALGDLDLDLGV